MNSITRQAIIDEVKARGWTYKTLPGKNGLYIVTDDKGKTSIAKGARFLNSSANGRDISVYKHFSYAFLEHIGYKVPDYLVSDNFDDLLSFLSRNQRIAVKPVDAEQSKGVTVDVVDEAGLREAVRLAKQASHTGEIVVQRQVEGKLYRLLVVNNQLFAAAYRRAAFVVGDGQSTILQLINEKNQDPNRSDDAPTPLKKIKIDEARKHLGEEGLYRVPGYGEEVEVIAIASISAGGEAEDVTESVHPFYKSVVEDMTTKLGLSIAGVDIITDDITTSEAEENYFPIIEINSLPGFKLHLHPTAGGVARNPAAAVLDAAFSI